MEDLYGNLENYNDVNALEELKSENKELKIKLEDYASAMDKLQKNILQDFDTLSSEFKKLEHNYSSLLKTAKLEIERKTKIITDMNIEKDMLVLAALKNGNKSVLHVKKHMPAFKKNISGGVGNKGNVKNVIEVQGDQNKRCDSANKRLQEQQRSSNDKVDIINKEKIHKQKTVKKYEPYADSSNNVNSHTKENVQHNINMAPFNHNENIVPPVESKLMTNKNKYKSITPIGMESDKITENTECSRTENSQQDVRKRDKEDRKTLAKYEERHSSKSSETSSRDEKISGYLEPSYTGRSYRHYDSDKHRSRHKYEMSQRYKKYSPDRHKNHPRDYYEDNSGRSNFNKKRIRESPPLDRFYHYSYKEHTSRSDHDRYNFNDHERYSYVREKNAGKHKMFCEYEETYPKKQKTDYYGRRKDDVRWHGEEIEEHQELTETFEKLQNQYTSCQSPDYEHNEIAPEPIKVILDTADAPLEDPRLTTKSYVLSNENGSSSLYSVKGRCVDILPVNKAKWQLQNLSMPNALIQPPVENQLIKDLYMDIDEQPKLITVSKDTGKLITKDKKDEPINRVDIIDKTGASAKVKDNKAIQKQSCTNYKIPKRKKCEEEMTSNTSVKDSSQVIENVGGNLYHNDEKLNSKSNKLTSENTKNHDSLSLSVDNTICTVVQNSINERENQRVLSTREIVEGDLELSDETCDNTELQKTNNSKSAETVDSCPKSSPICPTNLKDTSNFSNIANCHSDQIETAKISNDDLNTKDKGLLVKVKKKSVNETSSQLNEIGKKLKSKRKEHKHKESEFAEAIEKKTKPKKDKKEKPIEIKSKFNDLFGDSNSLITPDDLGISTSKLQTCSQLTDIYVPIFEDAQDATDLKTTKNIQPLVIPKIKDIDEVNTSIEKDNKEDLECNPNEIKNKGKDNSEETNDDIKLTNETESKVKTVHDNLNIENIGKEDDVVQTIVISTGIQPDENNTESRAESLVNAEELLSEDIELDHINATHKTQDVLIKALATSTPHKKVVNQIALEINSKLPDSSLSSNKELTNIETFVPNTSNALEPLNEDLPDVRIFVKRRRRVVKIK